MHIKFLFSMPNNSSVRLPSANLHLFQAMLYSLLPPEEASILHDVGFNSDGRKMKLFAMSWPSSASRPQFGAETVIFPLPITLTVTTPIKKLIEGFTCKALSKEYIRIGNNKFICNSIETEQQTANSTDLTVKTLSPITCYETVENNGKHYTRYLSPYDEKFQKAIFVNLIRKFRLLNPDHEIPDDDFRITPIGTLKERISMYDRRKNGLFPIKGWWGNFRIEGNMELLQIALDCGLGSKNSSGWGCVSK